MNQDLARTYDRIAEDWHKDHLPDDWWVEGVEAFLSLLPPGGTVLDVGCGSGVKSKYLTDHGFSVTGIDISQKLLDIARREVPGATFRLLPMEELDALSEVYDGVFSQASLLHIPRKEAGAVVGKMAARLRPGGHLYLCVKELRPDKPKESVLTENDYGYPYERFFSYFSMDELQQYLAAAGLSVVWSSRNPHPSGKTVWLHIVGHKAA